MGKKIRTDQFAELAAAVVSSLPRDIEPESAQYWITHNFELTLALRGALAASLPVINFRRLLDFCHQDWVDSDFNEGNYPLEPVTSDEADWEVYEYHFLETVTGEEAFRRLEEMGYRLLGGSRRAMEFIAAHPDLQSDRALIITTRSFGLFAPVFHQREAKRRLSLLPMMLGEVNSSCGWLVLRKRAA
jgi:hypothetical protein